MRVGDLVRIKPEHCQEEDDPTSWQTYPPDSQWIGLVTGVYFERIEVIWGWSGRIVEEYIEHLEVICE